MSEGATPKFTVAGLSRVFKAYDMRGVVPDDLSDDLARATGAAFVRVTRAGTDPGCVVVGYDMRPSSPGLATAFAEGAAAQGADVIMIGLASTDVLYFASGSLNMPGAMFTASHNPAKYNGIKMTHAGASPVGSETGLTAIRDLVASGVPAYDGERGTLSQRDVLPDYAAFLRNLVDLSDIRHLTVVVDAGNGMGGHTVPTVLAGLPLTVVPMYFELDGTFPNHEANPLDPTNLVDLQAKVREVGADIGLAFDGDADRCFVVDERGDAVSPSAITALVAVRELAKHPGATIIHNLITSHAVPEIIREHGGIPVRTRVGHSYIKQEMASTGAVFGGEHSAHYYFRDFWRADTGLLAALHVLAALGTDSRPLSEIGAEYERYIASGEINSAVPDSAAAVQRVRAVYGAMAGIEIDDLDGLTVGLGSWWFNLRASNTEPLLRLNVEAADERTMTETRDKVLELIRG